MNLLNQSLLCGLHEVYYFAGSCCERCQTPAVCDVVVSCWTAASSGSTLSESAVCLRLAGTLIATNHDTSVSCHKLAPRDDDTGHAISIRVWSTHMVSKMH